MKGHEMKTYRIHKPTHKILDEKGQVIGLLQVRGNSSMLNRYSDYKYQEAARLWSVGTDAILRGELEYIWHFYFGETGQKPMKIEEAAQ